MNKKNTLTLMGKYQLKARMKNYLPKDSVLDSEAVEVMQKTLEEIFVNVMKSVAEKPYKQYTGYIVSKECQKYFVQGDSLQQTARILKEMRSRIDEWFERLEEGKKEEVK